MFETHMVLVDYIGIFLHVAILLATYCTFIFVDHKIHNVSIFDTKVNLL